VILSFACKYWTIWIKKPLRGVRSIFWSMLPIVAARDIIIRIIVRRGIVFRGGRGRYMLFAKFSLVELQWSVLDVWALFEA
jgi:hypothetical protein